MFSSYINYIYLLNDYVNLVFSSFIIIHIHTHKASTFLRIFRKVLPIKKSNHEVFIPILKLNIDTELYQDYYFQ